MAISSSIRKSGPYAGNGLTSHFPFGFKIFDAGDIHVVRTGDNGVENVLVLGTDFSVTLNGDQDSAPGGAVVLTVPLASGSLLTLTSNLDELQPTVLTNSGGFYPDVLNDSLDRLTILTQQLREKIDRAVVAPITESGGSTIPSIAQRAGKVAYFDGTGQLAGFSDASSMLTTFDAVLSGTQPLLDLVGDLGGQTFAEAVATITDRMNFYTLGTELAFTLMAGGPLYRMSQFQSATPTSLAGFQLTRPTPSYAIDSDGTVRWFDAGLATVGSDGLQLNYAVDNHVLTYTDDYFGMVGLYLSGDVNATISIVDDTAALAAAGLLGLVPGGKVLRIDNSGGTGSATVNYRTDFFPNGTVVYYQAYVRVEVTGTHVRTGVEGGGATAEKDSVSTTYVPVGDTVQLGSGAARMYSKANTGSIVYAVLPSLTAGKKPPSRPVPIRNPHTFTGIIASNIATTVLDPTTTANVTKSGDNASVLSVTDDTADIPIRTIIPSKATTKVYQLDNTAGTGDAYAEIASASPTVVGTSYQVYTFIRRASTSGSGALQFEGADKATYGRTYWQYIGGTYVAATTSGKARIRVAAGASLQFLQVYVQAGTALPPALSPWAGDSTVLAADNLVLAGVSNSGNLLVEWGGGYQTVLDTTHGSVNIGADTKRPWMGQGIDNITTQLPGQAARVYTPQAALSNFVYIDTFAGTALDLSPYTNLVFSDDFDTLKVANADTGVAGPSVQWFAPGHTTFGFATFNTFTQSPTDTYSIAGGKLRIRMQNAGSGWTTGCLSSVNSAGQGFRFDTGYAEASIYVPATPGAWCAFWATNEVPGLNQPHAEIDFVEAYGTDTSYHHSTAHIWPSGYANPHGPQNHVLDGQLTPSTLPGAYHQYGCEITEDWIIHYLDRVELCRIPRFAETRLAPFHLLLNLAGLQAEAGSASSPIDMLVDYVKVWTR